MNQFTPKDYVDSNIYNSLMTPPTQDEWFSILDQLPNDKACDPSQIPNEFYKHAGPSIYLLT